MENYESVDDLLNDYHEVAAIVIDKIRAAHGNGVEYKNGWVRSKSNGGYSVTIAFEVHSESGGYITESMSSSSDENR